MRFVFPLALVFVLAPETCVTAQIVSDPTDLDADGQPGGENRRRPVSAPRGERASRPRQPAD